MARYEGDADCNESDEFQARYLEAGQNSVCQGEETEDASMEERRAWTDVPAMID